MRPSKHSTGGGPVTVVGNSIRLQVPEVRWRRARAGGVYGLEGKMDSTMAACWRYEDDEHSQKDGM